ncbi:MAG: hypothetical protein WC451_05440 [Patescibacteria group bacterium]|jgi:hypothetical protein
MINNTREIELINYLKYKIKISDKFIEKKENRVYFDDIKSIRCKAWRVSASYFGAKISHGNFNRILIVDKKNNKLDLNFSSMNEESFSNYRKIVSMITEPLANKMVEGINKGKEEKISNLLLTKNGIYKKGIFGKKFLDWSVCANAKINGGLVIIFRENGKKFSETDVWKKNAIILPKLINSFKIG